MIKVFSSVLLLGFLSSPALACQPPPPGYFEWGNLQAIVSSKDVRSMLAGLSVNAIELVSGSEYRVVAEMCSLRVTVKAEQLNPNAPCGGPYTFTAMPAKTAACTQ